MTIKNAVKYPSGEIKVIKVDFGDTIQMLSIVLQRVGMYIGSENIYHFCSFMAGYSLNNPKNYGEWINFYETVRSKNRIPRLATGWPGTFMLLAGKKLGLKKKDIFNSENKDKVVKEAFNVMKEEWFKYIEKTAEGNKKGKLLEFQQSNEGPDYQSLSKIERLEE